MYYAIPALAFLPPEDVGGGPPPVTFRGLWFTRVWWPLLMLGPSLYALRFTRWSSHG